MDELSPGPVAPAAPERVGESLRAARELQGLSLSEVAQRTRVPLRHLEAIEANDYAGLPSPTYATGFARAYARAIGADEVAVAQRVRGELAGVRRTTPEYRPYEAADPARVPSRGVAIVALGLAIAVLVLAGLYFGTGLLRGGGDAPAPVALTPDAGVAPVPVPSASAIPAAQVLVNATDEVWVRIYDADGKTLHQGTLKAGEHFEVPADARDPMINVGRPDKLNITVNGSQLTGLDLGRDPIKDVRVSAAALTARASGQREPQASPTPAPSPTPKASPSAEPRRTTATLERRSEPRREAAPALSETQRANLDAAARTPPPGNAQ